MSISSRTPEGDPIRCPICGAAVRIEPSSPSGDAPCPQCGALLWFKDGVASASSGVPIRANLALGILAILTVGAVVAAYLCWKNWLGLGPTEFVILCFAGIMLFGPTLPKLGQHFGKLIVQRTGR